MPPGLLNMLTEEEVLVLLADLLSGLARYGARRNSMPAFMRELKQRFTSSIHEDVESMRARTTRIKDGLCSVAASQMMESSARK